MQLPGDAPGCGEPRFDLVSDRGLVDDVTRDGRA